MPIFYIIVGGIPNPFVSGDLNGIIFIGNDKNVQMTISLKSMLIDINGFAYVALRNSLSTDK